MGKVILLRVFTHFWWCFPLTLVRCSTVCFLFDRSCFGFCCNAKIKLIEHKILRAWIFYCNDRFFCMICVSAWTPVVCQRRDCPNRTRTRASKVSASPHNFSHSTVTKPDRCVLSDEHESCHLDRVWRTSSSHLLLCRLCGHVATSSTAHGRRS